jgi:hypothetical protein
MSEAQFVILKKKSWERLELQLGKGVWRAAREPKVVGCRNERGESKKHKGGLYARQVEEEKGS